MGRTRRRANPEVLSCGVVVVRRFASEWRYLLLRVYRHWDFPKGVCERGESPFEAALREVAEETTLEDLVFHWGEIYRQTPIYRGNKAARLYVAESPGAPVSIPVNPELGWPEHHDFEWCSYASAEERLSERLRVILRWANGVVSGSP